MNRHKNFLLRGSATFSDETEARNYMLEMELHGMAIYTGPTHSVENCSDGSGTIVYTVFWYNPKKMYDYYTPK